MTTYVRFMALDSLLRARLSGLDARAFAEIALCMRAHGVRGATRAIDRTFQPFGAFELETNVGTMSRVARARNRARDDVMYARVRPRRNARARRRASSRVVVCRSRRRVDGSLLALSLVITIRAIARDTSRRVDAHIARLMFSRNDALRTPKTGQSPINAAFCNGDALNVVLSQPNNIRIATKTYTIVITGVEKAHPTSGRLLSTGTPRAATRRREEETRRARWTRDSEKAFEPGRHRDGATARATTTRAREELEHARARFARVSGTRTPEMDAVSILTLASRGRVVGDASQVWMGKEKQRVFTSRARPRRRAARALFVREGMPRTTG